MITDHLPLTRAFVNRDFSQIHNSCLFKLKEKSLIFFLLSSIVHVNDKGPNAISCNPVAIVEAFLNLFPQHTHLLPRHLTLRQCIEESVTLQPLTNYSNNDI